MRDAPAPIGREARVVIKATDITLSPTSAARRLSVRTTLSGKVAGIDSDDGPIAGVSIALDGHGQLYALATRKAIDELGLARGDRVFALVKTVALDERAVAAIEVIVSPHHHGAPGRGRCVSGAPRRTDYYGKSPEFEFKVHRLSGAINEPPFAGEAT